jgi:hypothetical protein
MHADQGKLPRAWRPIHGIDHRPMQRLEACKRGGIKGFLGDPGRMLEHAPEELDEAVAVQMPQLIGGDRRRSHHISHVTMDRGRA